MNQSPHLPPLSNFFRLVNNTPTSNTAILIRDMAMRRIFWGFCRNWFFIDPLHYLSNRSDFGFEFAEIFVIEKRIPDFASRQVPDSPTRQVGESLSLRLGFWRFKRKLGESESRRLHVSASFLLNILKPSRRVSDSPTCRVGESGTRRLAKSGSRKYLHEFQAKIGTARKVV